MRWTSLLPHLAGLRVLHATLSAATLELDLEPLATTARCPSCQRRSRHVHSRYIRHITDQPIGGHRVILHLHVRRFRCRTAACPRRTFAEQAPRLAARYARRSVPLQAVLADLGLTVGGRPGMRFLARRGGAISRMTLLRLVRALPEPPVSTPSVLGVDDFALRRGHHYGTILTDLEGHRVIDLLPERTADAFATWLNAHGQPHLVCRDRGGDYASGARQGAPDAIQIADRFHLTRNSSDVLERILVRHPAALRAAVTQEMAQVPNHWSSPISRAALPPANPRRDRRLARYQQVIALHRQGWSLTAISTQLRVSRPTVRKYVNAGTFPEWPARRTKLSAGTAHTTYLQVRWDAGCRDATVLWQELQARGFTGSVRMVQRVLAGWRVEPARRGRAAHIAGPLPAPAPPQLRPPSPHQAVWLLLRPIAALEPAQQLMRARLLAAAPEVREALTLLEEFRRVVRERDGAAWAGWLHAAETSPVREVRSFAAKLRADHAAIEAALAHEWSSGQVEGHVTKTKLVKRQMYGRAKVDLLRKRVLLAS
jgi:transposase